MAATRSEDRVESEPGGLAAGLQARVSYTRDVGDPDTQRNNDAVRRQIEISFPGLEGTFGAQLELCFSLSSLVAQ